MSSKILYAAILLTLIVVPDRALADGYPVSAIPENLRKGASSVVREMKQTYTQNDIYGGTLKVSTAITILDKDGASDGYFAVMEDETNLLSGFSGEIISAQGKCVKKISKGDLQFSGYSSSLASSSKITYYQNDYPIYPYTILYEYEVRCKNNTVFLPQFHPVQGFRCSVEKSLFEIKTAPDITVLYKNAGSMPEPEIVKTAKENIYRWKVDNFESIKDEPMIPSDIDIFPKVIATSKDFTYQKTKGDISTWETFGVWQSSLLEGRNALPPQVVEKVKAIIETTSDEREKVKLIYEYMQSTTRYVSIQLGIGGWQPMPAAEVAKTGFGDCKALSNYMRSILAAAGIPSFYTIIRSGGRKTIFRDFPYLGAFNHAILTVPMKSDTLYLECTSQILPFGFVHDGIAGHDAWLIGDGAARIITLPLYADSLSRISNVVKIAVSPDASTRIKVNSTYRVNGYDNMQGFISSLDPKEQADMLGHQLTAQKPKITIISKRENRNEQPSLDVEYEAVCEDYAKISDSRLIVDVNPIRVNIAMPKSGLARKFDIELEDGYFRNDSIEFIAPEGYKIEATPSNKNITSLYGTISLTYKVKDTTVTCVQSIKIPRGYYKASEYAAIKKFFDDMTKAQAQQIVFKKTT